MNFLKKGPELKLSALKGIKVPDPVLDIYYDLKERHLLPVAAVLLAAIIVVPFALTQSGQSEEAGEASGAVASGTAAASDSGELVARSAPRLRKYQRRLAHLTAKDPFVQHYVEREAGAETSSASSSDAPVAEVGGPTAESPTPEVVLPESTAPSSPNSSPASEPTPIPTNPSSGSENPGSEKEPETPQADLKWFSYAVDVRVVTRGKASESTAAESEPGPEPETSAEPKSALHHNLPELTMLPSRKAPALTYMGSTKDGKKALMLVSSDVRALFGDARCVIGSQTCQLLALEPELPETIVYGNGGKTYTIELRKIHLVESSEINKAPLGEPSSKGE